MNKFTKLLAATALTAFAGIASAVPITGSIGFAGAYTLDGTNFLDSSTITRTDFEVHGDTSGSFLDEGIVSGTLATGADFTYNPVTVPVPDIWSVGSFMMDLSNMSVDFISATTLVVSGNGIVSSTDPLLDDTNGKWNFTANNLGTNLTWSSSANVPEPAIVLLLATGLIGFGFARKMRKA